MKLTDLGKVTEWFNRKVREFTLEVNGVTDSIEKSRQQWNEAVCEHPKDKERPARNWDRPAKVCDLCGKVTNLTSEEFYALFGNVSWEK